MDDAVDIFLSVCPKVRPNQRVLRLGLAYLKEKAEAAAFAAALIKHARIRANRSVLKER